MLRYLLLLNFYWIGIVAGVVCAEPLLYSKKSFPIRLNPNKGVQITKVALWMSLDEGQSWRIYKTYYKPKERILVEVPVDGTYGFHPQSFSLKESEKPPQSGMKPSFLLTIDTQKPEAKVQSTHKESLVHFKWTSSDAHFPEKPLSVWARRKNENHWVNLFSGFPEGEVSIDPKNFLEVKFVFVDRVGNRKEIFKSLD